MIKLIIFFRKPANSDAINVFEDRFASHVQLIGAMPNVKRTVVNRAVGAPRGEPAYYLIHEVFFADMAAANYALNTSEGRAAGTDLMTFAREISTLMFAEVWGEDLAPEPELQLPPAAAAAAAAVAEIAGAGTLDMSSAPMSSAEILEKVLGRPDMEPEPIANAVEVVDAVPAEASEAVAEVMAVEEPPAAMRPALGETL